jgi:FkbM family methyltransferase
MTRKHSENDFFAEPFMAYAPPAFMRWLISFCHHEDAGLARKFLAPMVRKIAVKMCSLPMDLTVGGVSLRCNFYDNYSEKKFVFTPWRYDLEERRLLRRELPKDGVFVDIGTNIGLYTIAAAKALGAGGRVLSFEPNPHTMKRLKLNLDANFPAGSGPKISLLNVGVADKDSEFELQVDSSNLGASSIAARNRSRDPAIATRKSVTVRCRPLLDVLSEQGVESIDVLKIDIEGAEDIALAPYLSNAPDSRLARVIIIENSAELWSCDLFAMMEGRGYKLRFRNRMNSVYSR